VSTSFAVASSQKSSSGYQGFMRASISERRRERRVVWTRARRARREVARGVEARERRPQEVDRARVARFASSESTTSGQPANAGCDAMRAAAPRSLA
jgi:hypothetical protein